MAEVIIGSDQKYKYIKKIWLDLDDTVWDASPLIQEYVNRIFPAYREEVLQFYKQNIQMWKSYCARLSGALAEAQRLGITPDKAIMDEYRKIIYAKGNDDVVRKSESQQNESIIDTNAYKLYIEPTVVVGQAITHAEHQLEMFYERRNTCLQIDGQKEHGEIPYELFYRDENLLPYAKENLQALYKRFGKLLAALTAHNGTGDMSGREYEIKVEALKKIIKDIEIRGIKFNIKDHDIHGDEIRDRSLKSSAIRKACDIPYDEPITGHILLDDSTANANDIYREGGVPIWIIPKNIKEEALQLNRSNYAKMFEPDADPKKVKYAYAMARSIRPESLYREFDALHLDETDPAKVLRKKMVA